MLVKPDLETLLGKVGSRYTLAILTAKRARQLVDGALQLAPSQSPNYVTTACEEIANLRVFSTKGHVNVHIPLRPDVLAKRLAAKAEEENIRLKEAIEDTINRNVREERAKAQEALEAQEAKEAQEELEEQEEQAIENPSEDVEE